MKIPVELLANDVHENRIFRSWKFVDTLRPKRDRKTEEQHRFDQDNGKFQVSGNTAADTFVIGSRMATLAEANQNKNEKGRPPDEEHPHEPVAEFEDVIDLVAVLGCVRRLAEELVDERQATHICPSL